MGSRRWLNLVVLALVLALGCGKSYQVAPISGRITQDGQPLAGAVVTFAPEGDKDLPHSEGRTDQQGAYTLHLATKNNAEGAVVGEHRVTITTTGHDRESMSAMIGKPTDFREISKQQVRSKPTAAPKGTNAAAASPAAFTCTVPPEGKQDADFDLKGK